MPICWHGIEKSKICFDIQDMDGDKFDFKRVLRKREETVFVRRVG